MTDQENASPKFPPPKSFLVTIRVVAGQEQICEMEGEEDYYEDDHWDEAIYVRSELGWAGSSFKSMDILSVVEEAGGNVE